MFLIEFKSANQEEALKYLLLKGQVQLRYIVLKKNNPEYKEQNNLVINIPRITIVWNILIIMFWRAISDYGFMWKVPFGQTSVLWLEIPNLLDWNLL